MLVQSCIVLIMTRRNFPACPSGIHFGPSLRLEFSDHKLVAMLEHDSGL